ncbi:GTP-binding protein [Mycena vulgaris]|nr:GTP-binding protein [Mycena vulgaris]
MSFEVDKAIELRSQCEHFRILVIGRANAGKTTLLKKVCNSIVDPEIRSASGEKRGKHDINNEMIFNSNRQFIFHDSRGFESGSDLEVNTITDFIAKRAATHTLSEQLHAIWYCLPTDTTRPLLAADEKFFSTRIIGRVPVIAIFTKFDGLITEAFTELLDDGDPPQAAMEKATEKAKRMLVDNFETPLTLTKFPLADRVRLDDMRAETSSCNELIAKTANALSDDTLRLLFVSVQQNNIYLSVYYAVDR